ncbi:hypothetical protein [Vibrio harveyi]|uniref:hypothetical protein n=1 Tax=Vibrio harveyi TaxID=669 RepID=UPI003CF1483F
MNEDFRLPFGLNWKQSISEVRNVVPLKTCDTSNDIINCSIKYPGKQLFLAHKIRLFFSIESKKLIFVEIESKETRNDFDGLDGVSIYRHLKGWSKVEDLDSETYEFTSKNYSSTHSTFYSCLNYLGCANYSAYGRSATGELLMVKLYRASRGGGKTVIRYQSSNFKANLQQTIQIPNDSEQP